jgi:transcriptional regulator GlxA family with amidase domain
MRVTAWEGDCLVGSTSWAFYGAIKRPIQMVIPATQIVILREPSASIYNFTATERLKLIQPMENAGPEVAPVFVALFVIDPATLMSRKLRALTSADFAMQFSAGVLDRCVENALKTRDISSVVSTLARGLGWTEPYTSLIARRSSHPRISRIMELMDQGQTFQTVSSAARSANLSLRRFGIVFKEEFDMAFSDYLAWQRHQRLIRLLVDPETNVTTAAKTVGFHDLAHYTNALKRFIRATASDFYGMKVLRSKT